MIAPGGLGLEDLNVKSGLPQGDPGCESGDSRTRDQRLHLIKPSALNAELGAMRAG